MSSSPSLIPLSLADGPTQRRWAATATVLLHSYKIYHLLIQPFAAGQSISPIASLASTGSHHSSSASSSSLLAPFLTTSLLLDVGLLYALARLRIPRLDLKPTVWVAIFALLASFDFLLAGGWRWLPTILYALPVVGPISSTVTGLANTVNPWAGQLSFEGNRVEVKRLVAPKERIIGQYTVHILPYSTATLSHEHTRTVCHCVGPHARTASLPLLFNNTEPALLQYSITSFNDPSLVDYFNMSIPGSALHSLAQSTDDVSAGRKQQLDYELDDDQAGLARIEQARPSSLQQGQVVRRGGAGSTDNAIVAGSDARAKRATAATQGKQFLFNLPVGQVGRVKLERVLDKKQHDARIDRSEVIVVQCPSATFLAAPSKADASAKGKTSSGALTKQYKDGLLPTLHHCPADQGDLHVRVKGVAPLELVYTQSSAAFTRPGAATPKTKSAAPAAHVKQLRIARISSPQHPTSPLDGLSGSVSGMSEALKRSIAAADLAWAEAQSVDIPLTLDTREPGTYTYTLQSVVDACGRSMHPATSESHRSASETIASRAVVVHPRARVALKLCSIDNPIKVLRNKLDDKKLRIEVSGDGAFDGPVHALLRYQSISGAAPSVKNLTLPAGTSEHALQGLGDYSIDSVGGAFCDGEVLAPSVCRAVDVPPPQADVTFHAIQDQCAGTIGAKALVSLSGTPPFRLEMQESVAGKPPQRSVKRIEAMRTEMELRPNLNGNVTYRFLKLDDANYAGVEIRDATFTQSIHPLADARFRPLSAQQQVSRTNANQHARNVKNAATQAETVVLHNCDGDTATVEVEFRGSGPFTLGYSLRTGEGSTTSKATLHTIQNIKSGAHRFDVEMPKVAAKSGGLVTMSLISVKDGRGCERALVGSDRFFDVQREEPTVAFELLGTRERANEVNLLQGEKARLPLRLVGNAPWTVNMALVDDVSSAKTLQLASSDAFVEVDQPGTWELRSVRDAHCAGSVIVERSKFHVHPIPRPTIAFDVDSGNLAPSGNDSLIRNAVCIGQPDAVDIVLTGHSPLSITYAHQITGHAGKRERQEKTLSSAQGAATLPLASDRSGWHTYDLTAVGDAYYPAAVVSPGQRSRGLLRLEQMVHQAPSAVFVEAKSSTSFCVGQALQAVSNGESSVLPLIKLSGAPPFEVDFSVGHAAGGLGGLSRSRRNFHASDVRSTTHALSVAPDAFSFDKTGAWSVQLDRVVDANGCETLYGGSSGAKAVGWETTVVETPGIVSEESRSDFCVGENIPFTLQGASPWQIEYAFAGKTIRTTSNEARFSRFAEHPGTLQIRSVAHERSKCGRDVRGMGGMSKVVHALPKIRISQGRHYIQDLPEGNQAEINFHLEGEPPFSFTYSRTEPIDRNPRPQVLETHTVTNVQQSTYTLRTSQEGTWSVSWLQDKHCTVSLSTDSSRGKGKGAAQPRVEGTERKRIGL
ncbi:hypothetical protein IE81DRAFT_301054 [Ceraceosorus guamensis]|uniref:Nucleoporin Pom152 n=1 Tax=Ceraceosorus guamensis TaxID=1522189 RepID=A0A316W0H3_9BASI|nr:hypothetical protein IE81DRAFT_301054 [Ceraceosorus guamensis]PWN43232.1 hypothetical protein IE81DRAFT_301054 [Ceraceosorus guamensis]